MKEIGGFDKLQRELRTAQEALGELQGELGTISMDPHDPASIDQAISEMERIIDVKVASYERNDFIGPLARDLKETYRSMMLESAAEARFKGDE